MDEAPFVNEDQLSLKRKRSEDLESSEDDDSSTEQDDDNADQLSEPRIFPTVVIDREGDLCMDLPDGKLIVSRKAMSLSSPVFLAMLGASSGFAEATHKSFASDGTQIVSFDDDDFEAMTVIARIIHLQHDQVERSPSFSQVFQIAILCDKYDLKRCLGLWPRLWTAPYEDLYHLPGYEGWLFISTVFEYHTLYKKTTRHFILNSHLDRATGLLMMREFDIGEYISPKLLGS